MPIGVQLRRSKGWRMPPNTVSVARPHRWGNRFRVGDRHPDTGAPMTARDAVDLHRAWATEHIEAIRRELRGRNLACFCGLDAPCHRNNLLDIANS